MTDELQRAIPMSPWPPRNVEPNPNPPVGSVGPNVDPGFGDTHVLYPEALPPPEAVAWQGWPVGWGTPNWNSDTGWLGGWGSGPQWGSYQNRISTVWSCVDFNARALSQMGVIRSKDSVPMEPVDWIRNPEPEVYSNWGDFVKSLVVSLSLRGEAFVIGTSFFAPDTAQQVAGKPGWPRRFHVAHPEAIEITENPFGGWLYRWAKTRQIISWESSGQTLLHVRYLTVPGDIHGHGPLEGCYPNLVTAAAYAKYGADLANRGGVPWGLLTNEVNLGVGGARRAQEQWIVTSANRNGAPAVVTGGWDLKTLTLDPKAMALLEVREFDEKRIAGAFGVPSELVNLDGPGNMTYSSMNMLFDQHWRMTLKPLQVNFMSALSNWALPRGQDVRLSAEDYVQQDFMTRTQGYQMMHSAGALTINEWRQLEGFGPIDDTESQAALATSQNSQGGSVA